MIFLMFAALLLWVILDWLDTGDETHASED
jgi:quinol-cytochrome oxidoreductase complex cytochrome b subunit